MAIENTQNNENTDENMNNGQNPSENKKPISEKKLKILNTTFLVGYIAGIVGVVVFLGIVIIGAISYGRVFLFDGYSFTKALTIISMILMIIGICCVLASLLLNIIFKTDIFPKKNVMRVLIIVLSVISLGFTIWGIADCSNTSSDQNQDTGTSTVTIVDFYSLYNETDCASPWATVDSSYLKIDTNPYNYDSDSSLATLYAAKALSAIKSINSKLGVPNYVYEDMVSTRAIDGRQTYSNSKINISWRYHPDNGLEVTYTR